MGRSAVHGWATSGPRGRRLGRTNGRRPGAGAPGRPPCHRCVTVTMPLFHRPGNVSVVRSRPGSLYDRPRHLYEVSIRPASPPQVRPPIIAPPAARVRGKFSPAAGTRRARAFQGVARTFQTFRLAWIWGEIRKRAKPYWRFDHHRCEGRVRDRCAGDIVTALRRGRGARRKSAVEGDARRRRRAETAACGVCMMTVRKLHDL